MTTSTWVRTPELDAFGPWILRVGTSDELPPLFRHVDLAGARAAVKVPRPIERRDARAGMDLYDALVVVRSDGVEVWSRAPGAPEGRVRRWLPADDLLALDEAIEQLQAERPHLAEIVLLRYYTGLSVEETAGAVDRSVSTVTREWRFARAWLAARVKLKDEG